MVKLAASGMLDTREASATREAYLVKRQNPEQDTFHARRFRLHERRTKRAACLNQAYPVGTQDYYR